MINKPVGPTFLRPFWLILGCLLLLGSSAQDHRFDIWKGKDIVGSILVKRKVDGGRTHYVMSSFSEFDILWKQQVRSLVSTEYMNGGVSKCYSHVKVNGNVRDKREARTDRCADLADGQIERGGLNTEIRHYVGCGIEDLRRRTGELARKARGSRDLDRVAFGIFAERDLDGLPRVRIETSTSQE